MANIPISSDILGQHLEHGSSCIQKPSLVSEATLSREAFEPRVFVGSYFTGLFDTLLTVSFT